MFLYAKRFFVKKTQQAWNCPNNLKYNINTKGYTISSQNQSQVYFCIFDETISHNSQTWPIIQDNIALSWWFHSVETRWIFLS